MQFARHSSWNWCYSMLQKPNISMKLDHFSTVKKAWRPHKYHDQNCKLQYVRQMSQYIIWQSNGSIFLKKKIFILIQIFTQVCSLRLRCRSILSCHMASWGLNEWNVRVPKSPAHIMGISLVAGDWGITKTTINSWSVIIMYDNSMGWCKKDVTPLLTQWSYIFLALTHRSYAFIISSMIADLSNY